MKKIVLLPFLILAFLLSYAQNNCNGCSQSNDLLLCENFESYYNGYPISYSSRWKKWSSSADDARVSSYRSFQGSKSLRIYRNGYYDPDVVFKLGDKTSGRYRLSWKMYIPSGRQAYYNIQHKESLGNWAFRAIFDANRTGKLEIGDSNYAFNYPQSKWFSVTQIVNIDEDLIELWIDGTFVHKWKFSTGYNSYNRSAPLKKLGAINFYARSNNDYYVDNICFYRLDCSRQTADFNRVCVNGQTYDNHSEAWCAGYTSEEWTEGACEPDCPSPTDPWSCEWISCTSTRSGNTWAINVQSIDGLQLDHWEINGVRQESQAANPVFRVYQPGSYTVCGWFWHEGRLIKCCKVVVCLSSCTPPATCDWIRCTPSRAGSVWEIEAQNISNMELAYWEVDGVRQATRSENPTFRVTRPGSYTITCWFWCGEVQIKCSKVVVCPTSEPPCCSDDPLSLDWVQNLKDHLCQWDCGRQLWCATYNGRPAIHLKPSGDCFDDIGVVYDCNGRELDRYGGFEGNQLNGRLTDTRLLWDSAQDCNPSGCSLIDEDFEQYDLDKRIGPQSNVWTTWSETEGGRQDGVVFQTSYGDKMLYIYDDAKQDVILKLGNKSAGKYELKWKFWIPTNKTAYFNIQRDQNSRRTGGEFRVNYYQGGNANLIAGNYGYSFSYQQDKWIEIRMQFDFSNRKITFFTPEGSEYTVLNMGSNFQLGAVNFYAPPGAQYLVDNIALTDLNCSIDTPVSLPKTKGSDTQAPVLSIADPTDQIESPGSITLGNYPNPFREKTTIFFELPEDMSVELDLYNLSGQMVFQLRDDFYKGRNEVVFENTRRLPAGMYFLRLQAGGITQSRSIVISD